MLSIIAYRSGKIRSSLSCESGTEINEPPVHTLDIPINKCQGRIGTYNDYNTI